MYVPVTTKEHRFYVYTDIWFLEQSLLLNFVYQSVPAWEFLIGSVREKVCLPAPEKHAPSDPQWLFKFHSSRTVLKPCILPYPLAFNLPNDYSRNCTFTPCHYVGTEVHINQCTD